MVQNNYSIGIGFLHNLRVFTTIKFKLWQKHETRKQSRLSSNFSQPLIMQRSLSVVIATHLFSIFNLINSRTIKALMLCPKWRSWKDLNDRMRDLYFNCLSKKCPVIERKYRRFLFFHRSQVIAIWGILSRNDIRFFLKTWYLYIRMKKKSWY